MKRLWCLLIGLLPFGLSANEMKVPFSVPVDFSKKGTVYETDFQASWNMWGSLISFNLMINYFDELGYTNTRLTEEQWKIRGSISHGMRNDIPIPKKEQQYFKLKVTLIPLGWASNNITIKTLDYSQESWTKYKLPYEWVLEKNVWLKKEYKDDKKIEFIVSIPLYGGDCDSGDKRIMIADLQRFRNYHIKVESLEDVELPKDIKIKLDINRYSTKH